MTEGILGRHSAPSLRLRSGKRAFTRLHAIILSRRYAAACKRAARMARLSRFLHDVHLAVSAAAVAAMPVRYACAGAAVAVAGRAAVFSELAGECGLRAREGFQDILSRRPVLTLRGGRIRTAGMCVFAAAAVVIFTVSMYGTGLEVVMDGEPMGYVHRQSEVVTSIGSVSARVSDILGVPYVMQPDVRYRVSIVRRSKIFDQREFEQKLFESVGAVKLLHVLTVDGETVGALTSREAVGMVLDGILAQYPTEGETDTVGFTQDVRIEFRYTDAAHEVTAARLTEKLTEEVRPAVYDTFSASEGLDAFCRRNGITWERLEMLNPDVDFAELADGHSLLLNGALPFLSVARGHQIRFEVEVPFEIEYRDNTDMYKGEERVKVEGVNGMAIVTAEEMNLDGQVVSVNEQYRTVTLPPVTQIVEQGTKVKYALGTFRYPISGARLTSPYGKRWGGFHYGMDFGAPKNTRIRASDGGKIIFAGWYGTYGNLVIIQHSSQYKTYYAHCNSIDVKVGQMVAQGDTIARVGSTGRSTGYHVHFEVRSYDKPLNPANYLKR